MKLISVTLALVIMTASCGNDSASRKGSDSNSPQNPNVINGNPIQLLPAEISVPVETFLLSGKIPSRLKAVGMTIFFTSNIEKATFECRTDVNAAFTACTGANSFTFLTLVNGQSYFLSIRAKAPNGSVDTTPVEINFVVDVQNGVDPSVPTTEEEIPITVDVLPREMDVPEQNAEAPSRELLVGGFYAAVTPYNMHVASFSTTKTYNASVHMLRVIGNKGLGSAYEGTSCNLPWEFKVNPNDGSGYEYCEANPTRQQILTGYANPMPLNHVEIVRGTRAFAEEKIFVAAFDGEEDAIEHRIGIHTTCGNTSMRGEASIPVLNKFLGVAPEKKLFQWCQVRASNGTVWWVGYMGAYLSTTQITTINADAAATTTPTRKIDIANPPRMKVVYSILADANVPTQRDFMARAANILSNVIVPLGPVVK